jgi:hypothetical protein
MMAIGHAIAGDPDRVGRFLQEQIEQSASNYLVGQFAFGDLSLGEARRSVELFRKHVMPQLTQ